MTDELCDLFERMDRWRHLPKYKFEGNVQPLIGFFLPDILSSALNLRKGIHATIIPEFPLRRGTLDKCTKKTEKKQNYSYNVDYVAFGKDNETAYLVELKTDMRSIRRKWHQHLEDAREKGFLKLVLGVKELAKASKQRRKYVHLLNYLAAEDISIVNKHAYDELAKISFPPKKGWTGALDGMNVQEGTFNSIEIVYIQPKIPELPEPNTHYIDFDEVAKILKQKDSILAKMLAQLTNYLTENEAGEPCPRKV